MVCSLMLCEMWTYLVPEGNIVRNRPDISVLEFQLGCVPWTLMVGWLGDVINFYYVSSFL